MRGNSSTDAQVLGPLLAGDPRVGSRYVRTSVEIRRRMAGLHAEERARDLAEPHVGRGDDRDLGDVGHAHEKLLDLLPR